MSQEKKTEKEWKKQFRKEDDEYLEDKLEEEIERTLGPVAHGISINIQRGKARVCDDQMCWYQDGKKLLKKLERLLDNHNEDDDEHGIYERWCNATDTGDITFDKPTWWDDYA